MIQLLKLPTYVRVNPFLRKKRQMIVIEAISQPIWLVRGVEALATITSNWIGPWIEIFRLSLLVSSGPGHVSILLAIHKV